VSPLGGLNEITNMALTRLRRAIGNYAADQRAAEILAQMGLAELRTMDDLLEFANRLLTFSGPTQVVGNALKVSAILRGARER
jgi:hypothetical protein